MKSVFIREFLEYLAGAVELPVGEGWWADLYGGQLDGGSEFLSLPALLVSYESRRAEVVKESNLTLYVAFRRESYADSYLNQSGGVLSIAPQALAWLDVKEQVIAAIDSYSGCALVKTVSDELLTDYPMLYVVRIGVAVKWEC